MTIKLGDQIIQIVNNAIFMGIHIDDALQWETDMDHVKNN